MKTLLSLLALIAAIPLAALAEDRVESYDAAKSVVAIDQGGILKAFHLRPLTEFTINGERATFDKLVPGMAVTISLSDPQTLSRIAAHTTVLPKASGHSFILKMRVDGNDIVRVKDGQLTIEHKGWDKPDQIFINGIEWDPKWDGNMTDSFKSFIPPLLPFGQSKPILKQVSGRCKVLMDRIQGGDFEKVLTLHFDDAPAGSDIYEIHVSWPVD